MSKRYLVVDGTNIAHRGFYSHRDRAIVDPQGNDIRAIMGFFQQLNKAIRRAEPTHLFIAFDSATGSKARKDLYPEYKQGRSSTPQELSEQLPVIPAILQSTGIASVESDQLEADDLIAGVVAAGEKAGMQGVVFSSDKDLHQLISEKTIVLKPDAMEFCNTRNIKDRFGIEPRRWTDYAAIVGEGSDNLPGIPGLGAKKAVEVINAFDSIEDAVNDERLVDVLGKSFATKMRNGIESFRLCKQIGTLYSDENVDIEGGNLNALNLDNVSQILDINYVGKVGERFVANLRQITT